MGNREPQGGLTAVIAKSTGGFYHPDQSFVAYGTKMTKICTFPVQILFDRGVKKAVSVGKTSPWAEKTLRPNKLDRHAARGGRQYFIGRRARHAAIGSFFQFTKRAVHAYMTSTQFSVFWTPPPPCLHFGKIHSTKPMQPPLLRLHLGNPLPPLGVDII